MTDPESRGSGMRLRFAPSPTGTLHVGGARTAVLNWLLARRAGGSFVVRIEDTDLERNVEGATDEVLEELRWLGLDWDEGPGIDGPFGPYRQSERGDHYRAAVERLLGDGRAYGCTCPPREEAPGTLRTRCACVERHAGEGIVPGRPVRFLAAQGSDYVVHDAVRGEVRFPADAVEDFVLLRSNGRPTYNFAVVVDDAGMRISHVIRGVDHLNNTPRQVALYEALGYSLPVFAHIPLILGEDRQKLSKRHGATSVAEHRRQGYLPEALVNYLSLLSWSSPSGEEYLEPNRLMAEVDLERVGASDAVFDAEKLRWLSHRHMQALDVEELLRRLQGFVDFEVAGLDESQRRHALAVVQERLWLLTDAPRELSHFTGARSPEQKERRSGLFRSGEAATLLAEVARRVAELERWEPEEIGRVFREAGKEAGVRGRALFQPLRIALTGEEHGPDLSRIAYTLGPERVGHLLREGNDRV